MKLLLLSITVFFSLSSFSQTKFVIGETTPTPILDIRCDSLLLFDTITNVGIGEAPSGMFHIVGTSKIGDRVYKIDIQLKEVEQQLTTIWPLRLASINQYMYGDTTIHLSILLK